MKIVDAEIYRFSIPLVKPLKIKSITLTKRNGLLLKLTDDQSNYSFGEISPLPGFHSETPDQAEQQIFSLLNDLKCEYRNKPDKDFNLLPIKLKTKPLFPSVQFGIEMAIWDLMSPTNQHHDKVKVNGLLSGSTDEMMASAKKLLNEGYDALKLKVGREDIDSEISFIHQLRKSFGTQFQLRLDANQEWKYDETVYFAKNVADIQIEYIEEPLKDFLRLEELHKQTKLPFAIDESFPELKDLPCHTKALIIKPSFVGGISKTCELIYLTLSMGIQPIITSAFESGLGLRTLTKLASLIPVDSAMGLDTFRWFKEDLIEPSFKAKNGYVDASSFNNKYEMNNSLLLKIS